MPVAIFALTASMFAIGTTEFVIVGLLPTIASNLRTSVSTVGLIVTAYALGIAIGGPILSSLTSHIQRKRLLLILMACFVLGNLACALAPNIGILIAARVLTSFTHAVFTSVGIVMAINLVDEERQGRVIAAMFGGVTVALAIGVPLGTLIGQHLGWRATFYAVAIVGAIAGIADARLLPDAPAPSFVPLRRQLAVLSDSRVVLALLTTLLGFAGLITAYTYVTPFLEHISGFGSGSISLLLVVFGVAAAAGTFLSGAAVDRYPARMPVITLASLAVVLGLMTLFGETELGAVIMLLAWGASGFACGPVLQHQAARAAPDDAQIVSALNISAFNFGIASGAFIGGRVVAGLGVHAVTLVGGAIVACAAVLAAVITARARLREADYGAPVLAAGLEVAPIATVNQSSS